MAVSPQLTLSEPINVGRGFFPPLTKKSDFLRVAGALPVLSEVMMAKNRPQVVMLRRLKLKDGKTRDIAVWMEDANEDGQLYAVSQSGFLMGADWAAVKRNSTLLHPDTMKATTIVEEVTKYWGGKGIRFVTRRTRQMIERAHQNGYKGNE